MSRSHATTHADSPSPAPAPQERTLRIRQLNDQLRSRFSGGRIMVTSGIESLASDSYARAIRAVATFADFNPDNDPHDEHDFGAVSVAGQRILWKIDYYDQRLEFGSPDPADPKLTARVLTIMLAEEY